MAQAEHLPIYKASYDLCLYLEQGCGPLPAAKHGSTSRPHGGGAGIWLRP
jgi:hypothetical protein